jgi:uncharacterized membrane protein YphA (DoxX/SURF4 family)
MNKLHQLEQWSTTHHPRWFVFLRVALGISLFLKGISFMQNAVSLQTILAESGLDSFPSWFPLLITWAHLLGGFLIIIGLLTRWAALLQIPILCGAVILVNSARGIVVSEFAFSLTILLLLMFFFIEGGGPISLDNYFKKNPK